LHARIGQKNLKEGQVAHYMTDVISAVSYCHAHNVIHGDLKPENFVFTSRGPAAQIKLIDFGISTRKGIGESGENFQPVSLTLSFPNPYPTFP